MNSILKKVTLTLPTKNRPELLGRVLSYYAKMKASFTLYICDSSDPEFADKMSEVIEKFDHLLSLRRFCFPPSMGGTRAVAMALSQVETPYAIFVGDDDFLIPDRVEEGVRFLDQNSDYSLVGGTVGTIPIEFIDQNQFRPKSLRFFNYRSVETEAPSQRLVDFFHLASVNNTFDIRRTVEMKDIFTRTVGLDLDADLCGTQLSETGVGGASIILGKGKKLPGLYLVMLTHEKRIGSARRILTFDALTDDAWPKHLRSLIHLWVETLLRKENLDRATAERVAQIAFMCNFGPRVLNHYREAALRDKFIAEKISLRHSSMVERILKKLPGLPVASEFLRRHYGFTFKKEVSLQEILGLRLKKDRDILDICDEIISPSLH